MRLRPALMAVVLGLSVFGTIYAFQRPWREVPALEYGDFPIPPDHEVKGEWMFARMIYPVNINACYGGRFRCPDNYYTMDYPRSDRHFSSALRRLTRVQVRSVEQIVDPLDPQFPDDMFNYPWMYAVEVGHWNLSDEQCKKMREWFDRGGFMMVDDFHGTEEWRIFMSGVSRIFPDREVVELDSEDAIFHTIYDLDDRYQVPGEQFVRTGHTYEHDGYEARWRGVYDDKGRVMLAICHNMDLGDSWEHADNPRYPEKYSALGFRIGVNYVLYAMTH
jgi:Domain of unknown function (DUF4159)